MALNTYSRKEEPLATAANGDASAVPEPRSRVEKLLLAAANGENTGLPEPRTREEALLVAVCDAIAGGGGGSVPKPLTYDYMPEGYPKKTIGTATVMEEQELAFADGGGTYVANLPDGFKVTAGQTYTVNWDGSAYECVGFAIDDTLSAIGNKSIMGESSSTTEPFLYMIAAASGAIGQLFTLDTAASHTISVKTAMEVIIPMSEEFLPTTAKNTTVFYA